MYIPSARSAALIKYTLMKIREIRPELRFNTGPDGSANQCACEGQCLENMSSAPQFPSFNQMLEDAISVIGSDGLPSSSCEASVRPGDPTGFDPALDYCLKFGANTSILLNHSGIRRKLTYRARLEGGPVVL